VRARTGRLAAACLLLATSAWAGEPDTDGDGLPDFQELHKYHTDPMRFSTAEDGVSDGGWERRREFTYSVRSVIKVMEPVRIDCLNDDYQDARVVSRGKGFLELEVVHYPLNTVGDSVAANPNWKIDNVGFEENLRPGVTTNWDEAMRRDLIAALKADGIDPDRLDDKEVVTRVAAWLMKRSTFTNMFGTHYIHFPSGKAAVYPGLEAKFASDKGDPSWTTEEQFERELFGRSMFAKRSHGTCTSTAVYLTTALRALGIPTRMVLALPLVDGTDPGQVAKVRNNLHHHRVRRTVLLGVSAAAGYANHTFNEVLVGGRWVRLNYSKLGQNALDAQLMGLLTHVNTFNDLSEVPLAATWGKRYALGERDGVFRHSNPYRAEEVSDHFGKYAQIDNPETPEHRTLTISRAYRPDSPECPAFIKRSLEGRSNGESHVLLHADEWFADEPYMQYKLFVLAAPKEFLLRAAGRADVRGRVNGTFTNPPDVHEIDVVISASEYAAMATSVDYELVALPDAAGYAWKAKGRLVVRKER
jgi:Transglutaminase-like superfamily